MYQIINFKIYYFILLMACLLLSFLSCKKFVEVTPPQTSINGTTVFSSDATATSALISIYSRMISNGSSFISGTQSISLLTGLSADELQNYSTSPDQAQFYSNGLVTTNNTILSLWTELYRYIYDANAVIEGVSGSQSISPPFKVQLEGEAKFIRAFCHFYLTNLFGDVPLITTTDYRKNAIMARTSKEQVLQQIIQDLKDAQGLLNGNYISNNNTTSSERVRPNKFAASALLARVYLYSGDWVNAETQASSTINNSSLYNLVSNLDSVFLKNSTEAIWQLQPIVNGYNTFDGLNFILVAAPSASTTNNVSLANTMTSSFEINDNRKSYWVGTKAVSGQTYSFPYKYKIKGPMNGIAVTEYLMVLRLAEQFLIRSEARAQQNNISGAQADLNVIRTRAGLTNTMASDKPSLLLAIEHERQVELFTEWGHRWLDLKRGNRANTALGVLKGSNWQSTDIYYPIPQTEIQNNANLSQNLGY